MADKSSSPPPAIQSKFLENRADPLRQRDVATKAFEKVNQERQKSAKAAEKVSAGPPQLHAPRPQPVLQMKGPLAQGPNREAFVARQHMTDQYAKVQIEKAKAHHEAAREKT